MCFGFFLIFIFLIICYVELMMCEYKMFIVEDDGIDLYILLFYVVGCRLVKVLFIRKIKCNIYGKKMYLF